MVDVYRGAWSATLVLAGVFALSSAALEPPWAGPAPIDRHALVTRHNVELTRFDPESPLSVGNGEFAFTADVTGLQTFPEAYDQTIPLGTLSQWGWHTAPNPERGASTGSASRSSRATAARSATRTSRASARRRSTGFARTLTAFTSGASASG